MRTLTLLDKSALVRGIEPDEERELCVCAVTRLEVLYSARSLEDYERIEDALDAYRTMRMNAETFDIAVGAQRELAAGGEHRVAVPDLLIAACAQQHGASVLHADRHYETLAKVLDFTPERVAE